MKREEKGSHEKARHWHGVLRIKPQTKKKGSEPEFAPKYVYIQNLRSANIIKLQRVAICGVRAT